MSKLTPLQADTFRQFGRYSLADLIAGFLRRRCYRATVTLRWCQYCAARGLFFRPLLLVMQLLHRVAAQRAGIELDWRTRVGAGLAITHGWGLEVNAGARIGNNVTLFHGATIGRRDRIEPDGTRISEYPVIEDDVWVGPHAIIIGGVTIGRGARIAGGAFVTSDVAAHALMVGNPAVVARFNCSPDVMNPAPL